MRRRIIGLDLGSKTVGIAKSDLLQTLASPHETIFFNPNDYKQALHKVIKCLEDFDVEKIVLGLPKHMSGEVGIRGNISLDFKVELEALGYQVILWDERLSSKAATNALIQGNVSRKNRKKVIDQVAAVIILQGYLDSKN
ncbi:MAG: Holliday junction resolvase RuvX [Erysipelothrix sp.]|nr:Holliday junction resolvase RuvX [Erysipelothrix sp.]